MRRRRPSIKGRKPLTRSEKGDECDKFRQGWAFRVLRSLGILMPFFVVVKKMVLMMVHYLKFIDTFNGASVLIALDVMCRYSLD